MRTDDRGPKKDKAQKHNRRGADLESKFLRVIDANFNRAKEGLRVCEDVCRFWLNDTAMTKKLKDLRHGLTKVMVPLGLKEMIMGRDVGGDVGSKSTKSESRRDKPSDIFYANSQRVKESLRVLEEFSKLKNTKAAQAIKAMRYEVYVIEKKVLTARALHGK
ncbi:MAG: thiamine-phosphate pyrophosphorylase [Candidatus Omnitrophica bacterium]|nr:thiamine-phosphate pyrophosphorylase [Candidatus Omnitrophota bacterium]